MNSMKINPLFVLREIADEYVVIPVGEQADRLHGMLKLNEEGAFLWKLMEKDQTEETLFRALLNEYQVEADTAKEDISVFIEELKRIGCLL